MEIKEDRLLKAEMRDTLPKAHPSIDWKAAKGKPKGKGDKGKPDGKGKQAPDDEYKDTESKDASSKGDQAAKAKGKGGKGRGKGKQNDTPTPDIPWPKTVEERKKITGSKNLQYFHEYQQGS